MTATQEQRKSTSTSRRTTGGAPRPRRLITSAVAIALPVVIWAVASAVGVEVTSPQMGANPAAPIGAGQVVAAAAVASAAGWALLAALERVVPARAAGVWRVVAAVVLLASLGAPLAGPGLEAETRAVLVAMHLAVAGVLAAGLARRGGGR